METKLTIAEFKRIRYRIALALQTQPRFVFLDTVKKNENGFTEVTISLKGYPYRILMNNDTVIQTTRLIG